MLTALLAYHYLPFSSARRIGAVLNHLCPVISGARLSTLQVTNAPQPTKVIRAIGEIRRAIAFCPPVMRGLMTSPPIISLQRRATTGWMCVLDAVRGTVVSGMDHFPRG